MTNTHEQTITAVQLRPGDYCQDNTTAWARADAITKDRGTVRVFWTLANGHTEQTTYADTDEFTRLAATPRTRRA